MRKMTLLLLCRSGISSPSFAAEETLSELAEKDVQSFLKTYCCDCRDDAKCPGRDSLWQKTCK